MKDKIRQSIYIYIHTRSIELFFSFFFVSHSSVY